MKDIQTRDDVEVLITKFYDKARRDELIGPFFNEVVHINWEVHTPKIVDFWETTLFLGNTYHGNPMEAHVRLNQLKPMQPEHFERWVNLFKSTVDELFEGEVAQLAKNRAQSIAMVMQLKM